MLGRLRVFSEAWSAKTLYRWTVPLAALGSGERYPSAAFLEAA